MNRKELFVVVIILSSLFLPFMNSPLFRSVGDEKVYVAQAIEMERQGRWFQQSLNGSDNYHKGPVHYQLIRIGRAVFGDSPLAVIYMNFLGAILISFGLLYFLAISGRTLPFWFRIFGAVAPVMTMGAVAFIYSSQMEFLLIAFYTLTMVFAYGYAKNGSGYHILLAWVCAGICSWLKSPLHSVLLAISLFLFIGLIKHQLLLSYRFFLSGIVGAFVGVSLYIPILVLDFNTFWQTYIVRETLQKTGNGVGIGMTLLPLLTYQFFPWSFFCLGSVKRFETFKKILQNYRPELILGIAFMIPTCLFFVLHPYRSEIYCIPLLVIVGSVFYIPILFEESDPSATPWFGKSIKIITAWIAILPPALLVLNQVAIPHPEISIFNLSASLIFAISFIVLITVSERRGNYVWRGLILSGIFLIWSQSILLVELGKTEYNPLRRSLATIADGAPIGYLNLRKHTWSEWGLLQVFTGREIIGIHDKEILHQFLQNKTGTIIVENDKWYRELKETLERSQGITVEEEVPWKRWKIHAKNSQGHSLWGMYLATEDYSVLQKNSYIISFKRKDEIRSSI